MTKVLVVDDESGILKSTELLLTELGYEVVTTTEPEAVFGLLKTHRPDVLLQDVRMPGLDLRKLLGDIRADAEIGRTPVLLFSASLDVADTWVTVGATGMVEKPFHPRELVKAIDRVVKEGHSGNVPRPPSPPTGGAGTGRSESA